MKLLVEVIDAQSLNLKDGKIFNSAFVQDETQNQLSKTITILKNQNPISYQKLSFNILFFNRKYSVGSVYTREDFLTVCEFFARTMSRKLIRKLIK